MQIDSLKIVSEGGTEEMGVKPESEKCSGGFRDFDSDSRRTVTTSQGREIMKQEEVRDQQPRCGDVISELCLQTQRESCSLDC